MIMDSVIRCFHCKQTIEKPRDAFDYAFGEHKKKDFAILIKESGHHYVPKLYSLRPGIIRRTMSNNMATDISSTRPIRKPNKKEVKLSSTPDTPSKILQSPYTVQRAHGHMSIAIVIIG